MSSLNILTKQALETYERITRRLERAIEEQKKFPPRGKRTTAYAALYARIERLRKMQVNAHMRYLRRQRNDIGET